jgi:hypothetical protein
MRKFQVAAAAASAFALCSPAQAAIIFNMGLTTVDITGPTGPDTAFSFGYSDSDSDTPFLESIVFTNTLAGLYGITLGTSSAVAGGPNDVDITSALLSGTGIAAPLALETRFNNDAEENYGLSNLALGAGTFRLDIAGTRSGAPAVGGTSFGGSFAFQAQNQPAIPEPATWGMMLLGFGAIGAMMRRKKAAAGKSRVRYNFA